MHFLAVFCIALSFKPWKAAAANITVGIIGAGASGLYAAIVLQSLGIDYEILEASDVSGGRIKTHYFDPVTWASSKPGEPEYYDYYVSLSYRIIFAIMTYVCRMWVLCESLALRLWTDSWETPPTPLYSTSTVGLAKIIC